MRLYTVGLLMICIGMFSTQGHADERKNGTSYEEIQRSTQQLEKEWDTVRKDYAKRLKIQMDSISQRIGELKNALDDGDPAKRKEINEHLIGLKESRDRIRESIHEITATSVVKLSGLQKYFMNAKDDTKD